MHVGLGHRGWVRIIDIVANMELGRGMVRRTTRLLSLNYYLGNAQGNGDGLTNSSPWANFEWSLRHWTMTTSSIFHIPRHTAVSLDLARYRWYVEGRVPRLAKHAYDYELKGPPTLGLVEYHVARNLG